SVYTNFFPICADKFPGAILATGKLVPKKRENDFAKRCALLLKKFMPRGISLVFPVSASFLPSLEQSEINTLAMLWMKLSGNSVMNYEVATLYDQWDLKLPLFPPRSYLYHLQPIGIGTANVESLTGYITRLAQAHCIEPGILMERVVAPVGIKIPGSTKSSRTGVFGHTATFNGTGMMAAQWVQALESLTLRSDLRFLTMLTWTNVIPPRGLL
ncbi:MAG TPA: hypothetical protein DCP31_23145, partial [Cyanobacteria bacterium UBA8543]|nr:hypothetical protein [Cyanobacteria bacterium UBA8543]